MSLNFRKLFTFMLLLWLPSQVLANKPVSVIAYKVGYEKLNQTIEALGELKAIDSVTLTPNISEVITKIHFQDGQEVKQGDLLVEFNDRQEQAELKAKQISAAEAKKQYYRLKNLQGRATVSQAQIDAQYRDWQVLEAEINTLQTRIADLIIKAPFSGQLGLKQFSEGAFVEQGEALVSLDNINEMYLDLMLPDQYLSEIKLGQFIKVFSRSYKDKEFKAQITAISPQLDQSSRMLMVRAKLDNSSRLLKTNMLVRALVELPAKEKLTIPNKSIMMLGDHNFVYLIEPASDSAQPSAGLSLKKVKIETGEIGESRTAVLSGLNAGDEIVSQGVLSVNPRKKVMIKHFENDMSQTELLFKTSTQSSK